MTALGSVFALALLCAEGGDAQITRVAEYALAFSPSRGSDEVPITDLVLVGL